MEQYKTCTKCGQIKQVTEFGLHRGAKSAKNDIRPTCKECNRAYAKERYHLKSKQLNAQAVKWRKDNPLAWQKLQRKSYEANRENRLSRMKEWRKANTLMTRNYANARRARQTTAKSFLVTTKDLQSLLLKNCTYCKEVKATQIDHVIPLSRGGNHSIGNLTGACKRCNLSKGSKFITEWKKGKR